MSTVRRIVSMREGDYIAQRNEPVRDVWRILQVLQTEERPVYGTTKSERWYVLLVEEDVGP